MEQGDSRQGFSTRAIHAGEHSDPVTRAHNTPIYQTSTYAFHSLEDKAAVLSGEVEGWVYTRGGNPTTAAFEKKMADLEGAEAAVAGASGMAVIAAALYSLLRAGDHVVASDDVYTWAETFFSNEAADRNIAVTRVDVRDLDAVRAAIRPDTRVLYTEFLSNPTIKVADIPALARIARERDVVLIVDNTFTSPYLFRPLEHGAHLSLHSATKYISGHGDALAGVIAGDRALIDRVLYQIELLGSCISPFNSWLLLRGIKTLELRMERHCDNAMQLARFVAQQPEVTHVNYAGLESHPGHDVARRLLDGRYGGMLSFRMTGGAEAGNRFANALRLCDHAVSLGDVSTLVWPHKDELVRVSVGCENARDIVADFEQAFEAVSAGAGAAR
ncbi:MAG TPA: PLP-dependent aspartate aminotransferase family protein [Thermomicrobiaceae bacterium]|nr:PLP-dependent aspartate aminotransferase family protein [Thermomicrobiaceae bacterium]